MTTRKEKAAQFAEEDYKIQVTGRHVMVTEAMKNYAIEKISKLERFTNRIIDIQVIMDIQKLDQRVDIVMKVGTLIAKSHAVGTDMYACIDKAVHKLENQFRRYKSKMQDHTGRHHESTDMLVNIYRAAAQVEVEEINEAIEAETARRLKEELHPHEVVSEETMPLKVLTLDEAIMKMDLSGDHFLLFRSEEDRKLHLIYRREDSNYGLVHTES